MLKREAKSMMPRCPACNAVVQDRHCTHPGCGWGFCRKCKAVSSPHTGCWFR